VGGAAPREAAVEKLLENFLHIVELLREIMRPGGLKEWHRVDPREDRRRLRRPIPADSSCYPYHRHLQADQIVHEDDFW
jgi:hypothetical protein